MKITLLAGAWPAAPGSPGQGEQGVWRAPLVETRERKDHSSWLAMPNLTQFAATGRFRLAGGERLHPQARRPLKRPGAFFLAEDTTSRESLNFFFWIRKTRESLSYPGL